MRVLLFVLPLLLVRVHAAPAGAWVPRFHENGASEEVTALAVQGEDVIAAGDFVGIGPVTAHAVARFDGVAWSPIGKGLPCRVGEVAADAAGSLFAACARSVHAWDGKEWKELEFPGRVSSEVGALTVWNGQLHIVFLNEHEVWRWDGAKLTSLEAKADGPIACLKGNGGELLAGGSFQYIGGKFSAHVGRWTAGGWENLRTGTYKPVQALEVHLGRIYAGTTDAIETWDGSVWDRIGPSQGPFAVHALAASPSALYATAFPGSGKPLLRLEGGTWTALGAEFLEGSVEVNALAFARGRLWLGGRIANAKDWRAMNLAWWDGQAFQASHPQAWGPEGRIRALASDGSGGLLAAGLFRSRNGGGTFGQVARWTGSGWEAIGPWMEGTFHRNDVARVIAAGPQGIFLGGASAGGSDESHSGFRRLDGAAWEDLGNPAYGTLLSALLPWQGGVIAGGDFKEMDGVPASRVARWDGREWSAMGTGADDRVRVLAVFQGEPVAAGDFLVIGETAARVARWTGERWVRLDEAAGSDALPPGDIHAMTVWNDRLVVAGELLPGGGGFQPGKVAAWNGTSWEYLGAGLEGQVLALETCQGELYAGGDFRFGGGLPFLNGVARWNGGAWEPLGSGVELVGYNQDRSGGGRVRQLKAAGSNLWLIGDFDLAGGYPSANLAVWSVTGDTRIARKARRGPRIRRGRFLDLGPLISGSRAFDLRGRVLGPVPAP